MRYLLYIAIPLICFSCRDTKDKNADNPNKAKIELMETDRQFSKMSVEKGMKTAFIEYIDSNGVLLKPGYLPLVGANAIDYLIQQNDTAFTLTWQPHNAYVSKAGDLGYTYGIYSFALKSLDSTVYGTYVSIWKKQEDGTWKFILDSGNEGIGE